MSRFTGPGGDADQYLMLVNNSLERSVLSRVAIHGAERTVWSHEWPGGERPMLESGETSVVRKQDYQELSAWLAPGQEILYRVQGARL